MVLDIFKRKSLYILHQVYLDLERIPFFISHDPVAVNFKSYL